MPGPADRLKRAVSEVASVIGTKEFYHKQSIRAFCSEEIQPNDDACSVAARILYSYCVDDGDFNNFRPGVQLAINFLLSQFPGSDQLQQAVVDLKELLENNPTQAALEQWARSHFQ